MRPAFGNFNQIAYVTSDLDRTLAMFRDEYDVPAFSVTDGKFPAWVSGEGEGQMELKIALANFEGVQVELIQPVGGICALYADALPGDGSYAVTFHHVCVEVKGGLADWEDYLAALTKTRPVHYKGDVGPSCRFVYTDERARLGHYIEHVWFDPELKRQLGAYIPYHPT